MPPQPPAQSIPEAGRYFHEKTWQVSAPGDIALWGPYLFAIVNTDADSSADVPRLQVYLTNRPQPTPPPVGGFRPFEGLRRPVRVCVAKRDSIYVFVADAGDMRIKRYLFTGGPPRSSFTDPAWKEFSGIAVDSDLNVFVSDALRDTVAAYDDQGAFVRVVSSWGAGTGFVMHPHGLQWNGQELLAADTDQQRVVRLRGDATETAYGNPVLGRAPFRPLQPMDVAADRNKKFVYVADSGMNGPSRILKYLLTGEFVDSVYSGRVPLAGDDPAIDGLRYIAVEEPYVFASDPVGNRLISFVLADTL